MKSSLLLLIQATYETIYMTFIAGGIGIVFGLFLGVLLFLTGEKQDLECRWLHRILGFIVNATRSIPFIILLITVLPFTRLLIGTTIGTHAAMVPLALAAIPFYARICESAFAEIPLGLIEAAHAFGAQTRQLVWYVLIPESLPSLIRGMALTLIGLIGYSAMAGVVGGGGLGELAINHGYQRFDAILTLQTVVILIAIVQGVQWLGDQLAKKRTLKPIVAPTLLFGIVCIGVQLWPIVKPEQEIVRVGIMPGWPEDVIRVAAKVAREQYGFQIQPVVFHDYVLPNTALAQGSIDANIFQHVPYLNAQNKANHYDLIPLAKTFVYPMGFYSRRLTQISQLPQRGLVAVPNDPSNQARSLLLLEKAGLIRLKDNIGVLATLQDILSNPKKLQFRSLDAAQLPRVLKDVDLAALTNDYTGPAGLTIQDAILREGADSLYANVIVARQDAKDNALLHQLVQVMHSKEVKEATEKQFPHGAAIAAW